MRKKLTNKKDTEKQKKRIERKRRANIKEKTRKKN